MLNNKTFYCLYTYSTAIGIRCKDGVVLAVEKLITSKLHEPKSNRRIFTIDKHIGMVCDYNDDTCKGHTLNLFTFTMASKLGCDDFICTV